MLLLIPIVPRADSGWYLLPSLVIAGTGLGLLVSQLNNYTLAPISEERVSEAAGVNSAAGSFGLSFGLAFAGAIMLATLSIAFTDMAQASTVPAGRTATRRAGAGRGRRSDEQHPARRALVGQPEDIQAEIIRINTDARPWPCRWRYSCRSSPVSSGCSTRSGWCACPTPRHPARSKGWPWLSCTAGSTAGGYIGEGMKGRIRLTQSSLSSTQPSKLSEGEITGGWLTSVSAMSRRAKSTRTGPARGVTPSRWVNLTPARSITLMTSWAMRP